MDRKEIEMLLKYSDFECKNEHLKAQNAELVERLKGKDQEIKRLKQIIDLLQEEESHA